MDWLKDSAKRRGVWKKLEELILDAVGSALPGEEKMRKVVAEAARWLAEKSPLPDFLEIPVYTMLLGVAAQFAYDNLKDRSDRPLEKRAAELKAARG